MKTVKSFQSWMNYRKRDISSIIIFPMYLLSFYFIIISVDFFKIQNDVIRNSIITRLFIYFLLISGTQIILRLSEDFLRKILGKKNIEIEKETSVLIHIVVIIIFFILVSIND